MLSLFVVVACATSRPILWIDQCDAYILSTSYYFVSQLTPQESPRAIFRKKRDRDHNIRATQTAVNRTNNETQMLHTSMTTSFVFVFWGGNPYVIGHWMFFSYVFDNAATGRLELTRCRSQSGASLRKLISSRQRSMAVKFCANKRRARNPPKRYFSYNSYTAADERYAFFE